MGESVHGIVVRSPRGTGSFEFEWIANALDDEGVRVLAATDRAAALAKIHELGLDTFAPLISRPFDREHGTSEGIALYAYTILWRIGAKPATEAKPAVQRDWLLAVAKEGTPPNRDLVLASYRGNGSGDAAADIFDCAEMVQTIRFER